MSVYISRLAAAFIAPFLAWLVTKIPFLSFLTKPENVDAVTAIIVGIALAIYGVIHKWISKYTDPTDSTTKA